MDEVGAAVKSQLEYTYDIPFHIENSNEYGDLGYKLWPENDFEELFEIRMLYRQGIRLIIEVQPQRYAAGMLDDMQKADLGKINIFLKYIENMQKNKEKFEMNFNNNLCKRITPELWEQPWKNLKFRISVIPDQDDVIDYEKNLFVNWAGWVVGMVLALLNVEKTEEEKKYVEGGSNQVLINKYERNPVNRQLCLMANGYTCKICGFDFEKKYGDLGHHFIHVHHIEMVSSHDEEYYLNPESDLIPVCPNCHAMLHKETPPLHPDELRKVIQNMKLAEKEH